MAPRSNWVNLQDYLKVNEDTGTAMGQKLAADVGGAADAARSGVRQAKSKFDSLRAQGIGEEDFIPVHQRRDIDGGAGQVWNDTAARAQTNAAHTTYTGPKSIDDVDPNLAGQVGEAVQRVNAVKTEGGRFAELQRAYGAQGATSEGGGALDSFLAGGSAGGSAALSGIGTGGAEEYTQAATDAGLSAEAAQAETEARAAGWGKRAGELKTGENARATRARNWELLNMRSMASAEEAARTNSEINAARRAKYGGRGSGINDTRNNISAGNWAAMHGQDPYAAERQAQAEEDRRRVLEAEQKAQDDAANGDG